MEINGIIDGSVTFKHSTANKYSLAGHHEQKNKKTTSQIKFLAVTIKQQIKLNKCLCISLNVSAVSSAVFPV